MKKINTPRILLTVALLGTFAVAPLVTPLAQADPPRQAPAYGRRAKDKKDKNNKRDKQRKNRDRDDRDRNNRDRVTYNGTVTNVRSSREFDLRANGRTYNVYASISTRGLSRGDEVRVSGRPYGDNDIRNASVRITRNR